MPYAIFNGWAVHFSSLAIKTSSCILEPYSTYGFIRGFTRGGNSASRLQSVYSCWIISGAAVSTRRPVSPIRHRCRQDQLRRTDVKRMQRFWHKADIPSCTAYLGPLSANITNIIVPGRSGRRAKAPRPSHYGSYKSDMPAIFKRHGDQEIWIRQMHRLFFLSVECSSVLIPLLRV